MFCKQKVTGIPKLFKPGDARIVFLFVRFSVGSTWDVADHVVVVGSAGCCLSVCKQSKQSNQSKAKQAKQSKQSDQSKACIANTVPT